MPAEMIEPYIEIVVANHTYSSPEATCLSFRTGDKIFVHSKDPSGWWDGTLFGKRGWFPSNFVSPMPPSPVASAASAHTEPSEMAEEARRSSQTSADGTVFSANSAYTKSATQRKLDELQDMLSTMLEEVNAEIDPTDIERSNTLINEAGGTTSSDAPLRETTSDGAVERLIKPRSSSITGITMKAGLLDLDLPPFWGRKLTPKGQVYYFNTQTNQTTYSLDEVMKSSNTQRRSTLIFLDVKQNAIAEKQLSPTSPTPTSVNTNRLSSSTSGSKKQKSKWNLGPSLIPTSTKVTWDFLINNVLRAISDLNRLASEEKRNLYLEQTNIILRSLRDMMISSGTQSINSPALMANPTIRSHQHSIMSSVSRLVISAKVASGLWPPPDAVNSMKFQAGQVLLSVRHFVAAAQDINLQVHDPGSPTAAAAATNLDFEIAGSDLSSGEFIARLDENADRVVTIVARLVAIITMDRSVSNEMVEHTRSAVTNIGQLMSLVEDIYLPDDDFAGEDQGLNKAIADFRAAKDAAYICVNDLITAARTAMDEFAPRNAMPRLLDCTSEILKVVDELSTSTKILVDKRDLLEQLNLLTEADKLEGASGQGREATDLMILQRRAMSLTMLTSPLSVIGRSPTLLSAELSSADIADSDAGGVRRGSFGKASSTPAMLETNTAGSRSSNRRPSAGNLIDDLGKLVRRPSAAFLEDHLGRNGSQSSKYTTASAPEARRTSDAGSNRDRDDMYEGPSPSEINRSSSKLNKFFGENVDEAKSGERPTKLSSSGDRTPPEIATNEKLAKFFGTDLPPDSLIKSPPPDLRDRSNSKLAKFFGTSHDAAQDKLADSARRPFDAGNNFANDKISKFFGERPKEQSFNADVGNDYSPESISFNKEGAINGGTFEALIECLTPHDHSSDQIFTASFLMMFHTFATPQKFLEKLIARFLIIPPPNINSEDVKIWQEKKQAPIRLRVHNVLKLWLENFWIEEEDSAVIDTMLQFSKGSMAEAQPALAARLTNLIQAKYILLQTGQIGATTSRPPKRMNNDDPPAAILPRVPVKKLIIADIDPMEIARQLTIVQSKIFNLIHPIELIGQEWSKKVGSKSVNVKAMTDMSNKITGWVVDSILAENDPKKRAVILKLMIKTSDRALTLKNYDLVMALVSALDSSSISRLKRTWNLLTSKTMETWETVRTLTDSTRNYFNYRTAIRSVIPPCIPFLGLYLTDLTFTADGNPDMRGPGARASILGSPMNGNQPKLINFDKSVKTYKIITDLQRFQLPYAFYEVPELSEWLFNSIKASSARDAQELYQVSLLREPRENDDFVSQRDLEEKLKKLESIGLL